MIVSSKNVVSRVECSSNPENAAEDIVTMEIVVEDIALSDRPASGKIDARIEYSETCGLIALYVTDNAFHATSFDPRVADEFKLTTKEINLIFDEIYNFVADWIGTAM